MNSHKKTIKKTVYETLHPESNTTAGKIVNLALISIIFITITSIILDTVNSIHHHYGLMIRVINQTGLWVFLTEYILRMWACTENPLYQHPIKGRIKNALRPIMIIDLLIVLPFALSVITFSPIHRVIPLRTLQLFKVLWTLKILRYAKSVHRIINVIATKKHELFSCFMIIGILLIASSCLMYALEKDVQPHVYSSIPETMWWSITTLTTVGYGDMVPHTAWGKVVASLTAVLGFALFGIPIAIISEAFIDDYRIHHKEPHYCPHCGKDANQSPVHYQYADTEGQDTDLHLHIKEHMHEK